MDAKPYTNEERLAMRVSGRLTRPERTMHERYEATLNELDDRVRKLEGDIEEYAKEVAG